MSMLFELCLGLVVCQSCGFLLFCYKVGYCRTLFNFMSLYDYLKASPLIYVFVEFVDWLLRSSDFNLRCACGFFSVRIVCETCWYCPAFIVFWCSLDRIMFWRDLLMSSCLNFNALHLLMLASYNFVFVRFLWCDLHRSCFCEIDWCSIRILDLVLLIHLANLHIPWLHLRKRKSWTIIGLFCIPMEFQQKMKNWVDLLPLY